MNTFTYFISGHLDLTEKEFRDEYIPMIDDAMCIPGSIFIVGDAPGADLMSQRYLFQKYADVTVYHMLKSPRNNRFEFKTRGGFKSDKERDEAMTKASLYDIAWVRPGREKSGTAKNLLRRLEMYRESCGNWKEETDQIMRMLSGQPYWG